MISVCIASHNGGGCLKVQLDSILLQLSNEDEIIISDDGSTDETLDIIKAYDDKRIKLYSYKQPYKTTHTHLYVKNNFENALCHAKGNFIFLSDQDDYWLPGKVEHCLKELENCDLVIHNLQIADYELNPIEGTIFANGFHFKNYLMKEGSYYGCAMAFRKNILDNALPFPEKLLVHDIWIGLIAESIGRVKYISQPFVLYRYHADSISHAVINSIWFKVGYRIYTLTHLLMRIVKIKLRNK